MLAAAVLGPGQSADLRATRARPGQTLVMAVDLRGSFRGPGGNFNAATARRRPVVALARSRCCLELAEANLVSAGKDISMAGVRDDSDAAARRRASAPLSICRPCRARLASIQSAGSRRSRATATCSPSSLGTSPKSARASTRLARRRRRSGSSSRPRTSSLFSSLGPRPSAPSTWI